MLTVPAAAQESVVNISNLLEAKPIIALRYPFIRSRLIVIAPVLHTPPWRCDRDAPVAA